MHGGEPNRGVPHHDTDPLAFPRLQEARQRCIDRYGIDPEQSLADWLARLTGSRETARRILRDAAKAEAGPRKLMAQRPQRLTRRETEIARLVTRGLRNTEIADVLGVSAETVKSLMKRIFIRLGARDRAHAAAIFALLDAADDPTLWARTAPARHRR